MATPHDQAETVTTAPSLWRVRLIAALLFTIVALIATVRAEGTSSLETQIDAAGEPRPARKREQRPRKREAAAEPAPTPDGPRVDLRAVLAAQFAEEALTIERSLAMVTSKLRDADTTRMRRLAAASRLLQAAPGDDRMAAARQRAAARLLIDHDLDERRLLAEEEAQLRTAAARIASDAAGVAALILPESIERPARGDHPPLRPLQARPIRATLSRRGIELDVDACPGDRARRWDRALRRAIRQARLRRDHRPWDVRDRTRAARRGPGSRSVHRSRAAIGRTRGAPSRVHLGASQLRPGGVRSISAADRRSWPQKR
jgi:hypothetical protein